MSNDNSNRLNRRFQWHRREMGVNSAIVVIVKSPTFTLESLSSTTVASISPLFCWFVFSSACLVLNRVVLLWSVDVKVDKPTHLYLDRRCICLATLETTSLNQVVKNNNNIETLPTRLVLRERRHREINSMRFLINELMRWSYGNIFCSKGGPNRNHSIKESTSLIIIVTSCLHHHHQYGRHERLDSTDDSSDPVSLPVNDDNSLIRTIPY